MFGMMVYDIGGRTQKPVSFGNKAQVIETRSTTRIKPILYGVNYNAEPLEFTLVFGSEQPLDRWQMQEIALWLTGHQKYKWLTIDEPDLANCCFRCIITQLTPIHVGFLPYALEATIHCDCPYAYSFPFSQCYQISGETPIIFRNESSIHDPIKPDMVFVPSSGGGSLSIVNQNDGGREFRLDNLPGSAAPIKINNDICIISDADMYDYFKSFNFNFFRAVQGDNNLIVTGNGTLTISGRFLYNVGG